MRASNFISLVLLVALAIASSNIARQCEASAGGFEESKRQRVGSKWAVEITNWQSVPLNLHCKSKDDDLGEHVLENPGEKYSWNFKENLWGSTLYWCSFTSQNGKATFDVFWPEKSEWLEKRCYFGTCVWYAKNDGFYLVDLSDGTALLLHKWEAN